MHHPSHPPPQQLQNRSERKQQLAESRRATDARAKEKRQKLRRARVMRLEREVEAREHEAAHPPQLQETVACARSNTEGTSRNQKKCPKAQGGCGHAQQRDNVGASGIGLWAPMAGA